MSAMLYFLAYVVSNVLIVLFLFFCVMLIMLWALGKQKAAHRNTVRRSLSPGRHHHSTFPPNDVILNHNHPIDDNRMRNHYSHSDGPYTSRATATPSVAPRRLSFSTATPTMSTRTMHQPFSANPASAAAPAAPPPGFSTWGGANAAPAPVNGAAFGGAGCGMSPGFTSANTIIPQSQSHSTPVQGRRVTFSLTPEQQQNEFDKQASANLARRRAPALVSSSLLATLPGIPTAMKSKSTDSRDIPLIELFPSSRTAASNGVGKPPPPPNPAYEHDQYFRQAPPQQHHHRQEVPPPQQSLHQSRPWRSLYDSSDRDWVLGQREAPVNPFMPTTREMLRDSLDRGDYTDQAQSQPHSQAQPRRRPPPLPSLT